MIQLISVIQGNLSRLKAQIAEACKRCNRNPAEITIVAVTKTVPATEISEAIRLGIQNIGENRVQEAQKKFTQIQTNSVCRHLIGHLQTNKVKHAIGLFDVIQSVDSVELAHAIDRKAYERNRIQDCLIEVKISQETTKFGVPPEKLEELYTATNEMPNLLIRGLMAMAPMASNPEDVRPFFKQATHLFNELCAKHSYPRALKILSMGMSEDFEIAIEEGSNMIRIGRAIFQDRE